MAGLYDFSNAAAPTRNVAPAPATPSISSGWEISEHLQAPAQTPISAAITGVPQAKEGWEFFSASPEITEELVWQQSQDNSAVPVENNKPVFFSGTIPARAVYVLYASTTEVAIPGQPLRTAAIDFEVRIPEHAEPLVFADEISTTKSEVALRFTVYSTATWNLRLSSKALLRAMKIKVRIVLKRNAYVPSFIPDPGADESYLSRLEQTVFDLDKLPSAKRERIQSVFDTWPPYAQHSPNFLNYQPPNYAIEVSRASHFKKDALSKGLILPFLYFASMHPEARYRWATALEIPVIDMQELGDSHAEAYKILTMNRKGLQGRANKAFSESINPLGDDCNWYQILYRVTEKAIGKDKNIDKATREELKTMKQFKSFKNSIDFCKTPNNNQLAAMEELFLLSVAQSMDIIVKAASTEADFLQYEQQKAQVNINPYRQNFVRCGFKNEEVMRFYVWLLSHGGDATIFYWLEEWAKKNTETTPIFKFAFPAFMIGFQLVKALFLAGALSPVILIPMTMLTLNTTLYIFRDTPGSLLMPLIAVLIQKVRLIVNGTNPNDFFE